MRACQCVLDRVFPEKCLRPHPPPAQTKSFRSFVITALGAVSQNRENKLESHEEKSFMSDALITKKQAGLRKVELVGSYLRSSWGQLDTKISNNKRWAHK